MDFDYSKTEKPAETAGLTLKTVYVLHADRSYNVLREDKGRSGYVALRTLDGSGVAEIEGMGIVTLTSDTLLFFQYDKIKRYFCEGDVWDFWWFEFLVNGVPMLPVNQLIRIRPVNDELRDCRQCLELLRNNYRSSKDLASATLTVLLYKWLHAFDQDASIINPHQEAVEKMIAYMRSHISEEISVPWMAQRVGLSERRFRQVFETITGKPPKRFLDSLRIDMAEEMLNETSMPIGVIADKLGYSSQFHFSRVFQKFHCMPPSSYRRRLFNK